MIFPWKKSKKEIVRPSRTLQPIDEELTVIEPEVRYKKLSYQVGNLQGIGSRERQEDAFTFVNALDVTMISEKGLFAVVADGMGGMQDGKVASELAISCLKNDFLALDYEKDLAEQLHDSMIRAGEMVYQRLGGGGGSTSIACMIYNDQLYFSSVGDSFLYLKRGDMLYHMNREHNVLHDQYLKTIRRGSMDPKMAQENPEREALTQFLGMDILDDVDFLRKPFQLQDKDVLVLCSDGVSGVLTGEEILYCLQKTTSQEMCEEMERGILAANRAYQDNYTALVIQCIK